MAQQVTFCSIPLTFKLNASLKTFKMIYIYFDVWFPILMVFFILILILILLRVRRARRLRMGNSTVITAGVGKLLNKSRVMIDGPISDSLETARLSKSNHKCFMSKSISDACLNIQIVNYTRYS